MQVGVKQHPCLLLYQVVIAAFSLSTLQVFFPCFQCGKQAAMWVELVEGSNRVKALCCPCVLHVWPSSACCAPSKTHQRAKQGRVSGLMIWELCNVSLSWHESSHALKRGCWKKDKGIWTTLKYKGIGDLCWQFLLSSAYFWRLLVVRCSCNTCNAQHSWHVAVRAFCFEMPQFLVNVIAAWKAWLYLLENPGKLWCLYYCTKQGWLTALKIPLGCALVCLLPALTAPEHPQLFWRS